MKSISKMFKALLGGTRFWLLAPLAVALGSIPAEARLVYVTNRNSGNVSVIDTATNTVVATVTVGALPQALAVTPNGAHVYVANRISNTVSVINTRTNTVVATVTVGAGPEAVGVGP